MARFWSLRADEYKDNHSSTLRQLRLYSMLAFFAILGDLARKGLTVLTSYDGSFLGGVVWANFTSCLIMGIANNSESTWTGKVKADTLLFTSLTTGFCGTFSSFSAMVLQAFVQSANIVIGQRYNFPNPAYGIMEALSVFITHIAVSVSAFHFGRNLIKIYDPDLSTYVIVLENLIAVSGVVLWVAVICLISIDNWRAWTFSMIVSPIACWARYYISKKLNPIVPNFPVGTFTVNIISTIILGVLNLINRGETNSGRLVKSVLSCRMIQGLEDGFCGTLSTVSTFVVELFRLKGVESYRYGLVSIVVTYVLMLLILGSYSWTQSLADPLCS